MASETSTRETSPSEDGASNIPLNVVSSLVINSAASSQPSSAFSSRASSPNPFPDLSQDQISRAEQKRKRDDSTSLFTLISTNVYEVQVLSHEPETASDQEFRFTGLMRNSTGGDVVTASMSLLSAGQRIVEGEPVPVWTLTINNDKGTVAYTVSTNQAVIKLMRTIRPEDDANQTNQRLRRKWQTQKLFRVSAQDAKLFVNVFQGMAYMKFRAGLVLIEWPDSPSVLDHLTADKQSRPKLASLPGKRLKNLTKEQLTRELETTKRENEHLRAAVEKLHQIVEQMQRNVTSSGSGWHMGPSLLTGGQFSQQSFQQPQRIAQPRMFAGFPMTPSTNSMYPSAMPSTMASSMTTSSMPSSMPSFAGLPLTAALSSGQSNIYGTSPTRTLLPGTASLLRET